MKAFFLTCFLAFSQIVFSQSNPSADYPPVETVIKVFFKNYNPPEGYFFTSFQKKKDGYWVGELDKEFKVENAHLFWSKDLDAFVSLPFKEAIEGNVNRNTDLFLKNNSYEIDQFGLHPYYGYPGWTLDVIEEHEKYDELPDSMLYSLGRAYTSRSREMCIPDRRSIGVPGVFNLPRGKNSMNDEQLKAYLDVARKGIAAFYKLYQQNPDFQTIVGPIYTKYCNEVVFHYLQLHIHQNEEVARQVLVEGLYDPFTLATSRNFLNSCPPNAILATWGDGDTYPLLYVQAVEHFRKDVAVANLSLLQLGRYVQHIAEGVYDSPPLSLTLDFDFYNDPDHVIAMFMEKGDTASLATLFESLKNQSPETQIFTKHPVIPTGKYFFEMPPDSNGIAGKPLLFNFEKSSSYILIYDLFFLDLIYSTKGQRPLCYTTTCQNKSMDYSHNYMSLNGLVYLMKPVEVELDYFGLVGGVDCDATEKLLFDIYEYADFTSFTSDIKVLYQSYFSAFLRLAKDKLKHGEKEAAAEVADQFFRLFPLEKTKSAGTIAFIDVYNSAGQGEKSRNIWLPITEKWKNDEDALAEDTGYIKQLFEIAAASGNEELLERLKSLEE